MKKVSEVGESLLDRAEDLDRFLELWGKFYGPPEQAWWSETIPGGVVEFMRRVREGLTEERGWTQIKLKSVERRGDKILFCGTHSKGSFTGELRW